MGKKITPTIQTWEFKQQGKTIEGYEYDTLKIKSSSGKRLYLTGIKNGIKMAEVIKTMKFEDGKIVLSFGKNEIEIGTYEIN